MLSYDLFLWIIFLKEESILNGLDKLGFTLQILPGSETLAKIDAIFIKKSLLLIPLLYFAVFFIR